MKIAIVKDSGCQDAGEHNWYAIWERLCLAHDMEYRIFDSMAEDFVTTICAYTPDITLWRGGHMPKAKIKDMYQRIALEQAGLYVIPAWDIHYLYDHKIPQAYLFKQNNLPHPATHVFFSQGEAQIYLQNCLYPIVVKSDTGAGSRGVRFIENFAQAVSQLEENFTTGILTSFHERENYAFIVQEYIKAPGHWRIAMIGNNIGYGFYLTNRTGTIFASSQGNYSYPDIPPALLEMTARINMVMGWEYMLYDIIQKETGEYLILELTDTCGYHASGGRSKTYYRTASEWTAKEETLPLAELIFNKWILPR